MKWYQYWIPLILAVLMILDNCWCRVWYRNRNSVKTFPVCSINKWTLRHIIAFISYETVNYCTKNDMVPHHESYQHQLCLLVGSKPHFHTRQIDHNQRKHREAQFCGRQITKVLVVIGVKLHQHLHHKSCSLT